MYVIQMEVIRLITSPDEGDKAYHLDEVGGDKGGTGMEWPHRACLR